MPRHLMPRHLMPRHLMLRHLIRALLVPTARVIPWAPLVASGAVGVAVAGFPAATSIGLDPASLVTLLRVAAVAGACGLAFLLDDPAVSTIQVTPLSPRIRNLLRLAVVAPGLCAWWWAVLEVASLGVAGDGGQLLPRRDMTLEAATLGFLVLLVALWRRPGGGEPLGGIVAAPAVLVLVLVAYWLPDGVTVFPLLGSPHWTAIHHLWAALLVTFAASCLVWSADFRWWLLRGEKPDAYSFPGRPW